MALPTKRRVHKSNGCLDCGQPATKGITIHQWDGSTDYVEMCSPDAERQLSRTDMRQDVVLLGRDSRESENIEP